MRLAIPDHILRREECRPEYQAVINALVMLAHGGDVCRATTRQIMETARVSRRWPWLVISWLEKNGDVRLMESRTSPSGRSILLRFLDGHGAPSGSAGAPVGEGGAPTGSALAPPSSTNKVPRAPACAELNSFNPLNRLVSSSLEDAEIKQSSHAHKSTKRNETISKSQEEGSKTKGARAAEFEPCMGVASVARAPDLSPPPRVTEEMIARAIEERESTLAMVDPPTATRIMRRFYATSRMLAQRELDEIRTGNYRCIVPDVEPKKAPAPSPKIDVAHSVDEALSLAAKAQAESDPSQARVLAARAAEILVIRFRDLRDALPNPDTIETFVAGLLGLSLDSVSRWVRLAETKRRPANYLSKVFTDRLRDLRKRRSA
jgi:hypothetical protein